MSDCNLRVGGNFGFEIEDYSTVITISKRIWSCCECERIIPLGEPYEKVTGADETGYPVVFRTCLDCMNIAEGLSCDGRCHTRLWEDLEESGNEGEPAFDAFSEACVAKVKTVSAKTYLVARWRKWKGLDKPMPGSSPAKE